VLWNPADPAALLQWKESQQAAQELALQLHSAEVSSVDRFESAFKEATQARSAALTLTANPLFVSNQKTIAEFAAKNRMPVMYNRGGEDFLTSGGLMSYGYDRNEPYKRAAVYVDKILKGTKSADLPVEQPTKYELMINLKAAKRIGFTIPPNVLARADKVIK
jgi:putative ABC transport system substrate-binding protein